MPRSAQKSGKTAKPKAKAKVPAPPPPPPAADPFARMEDAMAELAPKSARKPKGPPSERETWADELAQVLEEKRPRGRPFQPGEDSRRNEGGRPPIPEDVKAALKAMTGPAVRRLLELVESPDETVAIKAVGIVLERTLGKATQPLELTGKDGAPIQTAAQVTTHASTPEPDRLSAIARLLIGVGALPGPGGSSPAP